ncbi:MAG: hypothetical protein RR911_07250 [Oscillospiraceae bacterium]
MGKKNPKSKSTKENPEDIKREREKMEKRDKIARRTLITIIILLLLIIFTKCGYDYYQDSGNKVDGNAVIGQLDGKTEEEIQQELDRVVSETSLVISINTRIQMKNGSALAPVKIENIPKNNYIMQVSILLKDTDEVIYESGLIYPNYHIQEAKFYRKLPKGKYDAYAVFSAYSLKTEKFAGQQKAKVRIEVNN